MNKLKRKGIKCNIKKLFFVKTEMEYVGFLVTHDGVKPVNRNIEAITNMNHKFPENKYKSLYV